MNFERKAHHFPTASFLPAKKKHKAVNAAPKKLVKRGSAAVETVVAERKQAEIDIDDEDHQNKKQKLNDSVVTTTTDDGTDAAPSCSDEVSILSTEEEAMMQQIRRIAWGGYFEGLEALIFGRQQHAAEQLPQQLVVSNHSHTTKKRPATLQLLPSLSRTDAKKRIVEGMMVVRSTLENSTFMIHICQFLDNESLMI